MNNFSNKIIALILLITLAVTLYLPSLNYDFAYDDIVQIIHNPLVTGPESIKETIKNVLNNATHPGDLYRPLTTLSYRFNFLYSGLNPASFHLTNIVIYALCCLLVFVTYIRIGLTSFCSKSEPSTYKTYALAFIITLIFIVHPTHVEAVANIVGRAEILGCLLGLSAINLLILSFRATTIKLYLLFLLIGVSLYFLALLAKESALSFVLIIPAILWLMQRKEMPALSKKRLIFTAFLLLITSLVMISLRFKALQGNFLVHYPTDFINPENPLAYFQPLERALHAFRILGDYILLIIAPVHLSADYSRMPEQLFADSYSLAGLLSILVVATFAFFVFRYRKNQLSIWGGWFFLAFTCTANIITPIGTVMAERLLFTPSIGAIAFLSLLIFQHAQKRKMTLIAAAILSSVIVLFFSYLTFQRIPVWENNQILFAQTLHDAPNSPKATYNYAVYLRTSGNNPELSQSYFLKTLEILPTNTLSMTVLADIELERKNYVLVEYWYRRILKLEPNNNTVIANLEKLLEYKKKLLIANS